MPVSFNLKQVATYDYMTNRTFFTTNKTKETNPSIVLNSAFTTVGMFKNKFVIFVKFVVEIL